MNPFDYLNSINFTKDDLFEQNDGVGYDPFLTNKSLSYFVDTVLFANEVNIRYQIPKKAQFDFLRFGISKRKRFSKWHKQEKNSELVLAIATIENISVDKVKKMLSVLDDSKIKILKNTYVMKERK